MVVPERWVWTGGWDGVWIARLVVRAVCNLCDANVGNKLGHPGVNEVLLPSARLRTRSENLSIRSL